MKSGIESIKENIKALAKERETTFAELRRNLILERLLTRLARSSYREKFVLKGGTLLAKYIYLGRETQDLEFFILTEDSAVFWPNKIKKSEILLRLKRFRYLKIKEI